ncbi:gata transcription factor [Musa troglodytarum]|uniref:Gata transcription factor n=1 Tax=Musa troglodytarum TaxID=320322 RepID=A0A9E7K3T4_9LILI|nr:gata transcription factor [Musa troglodytarum]
MSGLDVSLSLCPPAAMEKKCSACGETKSPLWRNGPDGPKVMDTCRSSSFRFTLLDLTQMYSFWFFLVWIKREHRFYNSYRKT